MYLFVNMSSLFIPPSNFVMVNDGLYMGSYPELINMPFLESCFSSSLCHTVVSN